MQVPALAGCRDTVPCAWQLWPGGWPASSPSFPRFLVVLLGLGALVLSGCGGNDEGEGMGGMPLPQQLDGEEYPGVRAPLSGRMVVAGNGCFRVVVDGVERLAVWPAGSAHDGDGVVLPGGERLVGGSGFSGTGAVVAAEELSGGFWPHVLGYCAPDEPAVLVLDDVRARGR